MKQHIIDTLKDIDQQIAKLKTTRDSILELFKYPHSVGDDVRSLPTAGVKSTGSIATLQAKLADIRKQRDGALQARDGNLCESLQSDIDSIKAKLAAL